MKRLLIVGLALVGSARSDDRASKKIDPAYKKRLVARNMALKQDHAFWTVYGRYQEALGKIHARTKKLVQTFVKNQALFNDQQAKALLDEYLSIETDAAKLKKDWAAKFLKVLPPVKVTRYYQLENKFSAIFRYELAQKIPLAR